MLPPMSVRSPSRQARRGAGLLAVLLAFARAAAADDSDWAHVPCVDRDGHVFPVADVPEEVRSLTFQELTKLDPREGFVVCEVRFPDGATNVTFKSDLITGMVHGGAQYGGGERQVAVPGAFLDVSRPKPWTFKLSKPGYRDVVLPIPDDIAGKVVWMGTHQLELYPADIASSLSIQFVDLSGRPLAIDGAIRIGMTGGGYPAMDYGVAGGFLSLPRFPPGDYYVEPRVSGRNGYSASVKIKDEADEETARIVLYPAASITLRRIDEGQEEVTLAMGMTQHDRAPFPLADGRELRVSQYGREFIFRVEPSRAGRTAILLLPGPLSTPEAVETAMAAAHRPYEQDDGPVRPGDRLVVLDREGRVAEQVEITAVEPSILQRDP
jgi:hypothetical protein